jgi:acetyltransferase-like isoleucine patch superfamily enzyme
MNLDRFLLKFNSLYYLIVYFCYKPFVKKSHGKFILKRPIIFTPKYFVFGKKVSIRNNARLEGVSKHLGASYNPLIQIGDDVSIEQNLHLTCAYKITIGSNTAIAANVTITDIIHPYKNIDVAPDKQPLEIIEVIIGNDCKIYNNAVILPGTHLGNHNIVGANSVVNGDFPDNCLIAGIPAKIIKQYNKVTGNWEKVK